MNLKRRIAEIPDWYHKIELPYRRKTITTPGWAPIDRDSYALPEDLTGKRILDVGAWDGYWTFECLKRGAKEVVAIDDFSDGLGAFDPATRPKWAAFDLCCEALGYTREQCTRREMSLYDITPETFGMFDVVLFFGTLYHLKHPLLAMEKLSAVCTGEMYIESAVCDYFSAYQGGLGAGYSGKVMEFYPGSEYGSNPSNWWVPTLSVLEGMAHTVGFDGSFSWHLSDQPTQLSQCRGFVRAWKPRPAVEVKTKITAVMSVPRLGFMDNFFCAFQSLAPLGIKLRKTTGAFWGQCLERVMEEAVEDGADAILTIDYDTVFNDKMLAELIRVFQDHPEVDAVAALQPSRSKDAPLLTIKKDGKSTGVVARHEFAQDLTRLSTAHFGLTLIRVSALKDLPHPWFKGEPDKNGKWGEGRIDDDIWFWKQWEKHNKTLYSANRAPIGHAELMVRWSDTSLKTIYQHPSEFYKEGPPATVWV